MNDYISNVLVDDEIDVSPIISVYDPKYNLVKVVDAYKSFIWTDRYNSPGEFELYFAMNTELLEFIKIGYYLTIPESEHTMIIESYETRTDLDSGDELIVRGRSLESILDRRVEWGKSRQMGNLQMILTDFIEDNFVNPEIPERKVPGIIVEDNEDPRISDLNYDIDVDSENVLDLMTKICQDVKIGFKMTLNDKNIMVFKLFVGEDRSYEQVENEYVIFSPDFENIVGTNFLIDRHEYKNVAIVLGTSEAEKEILHVVGKASGLERRELMVDARDIDAHENPNYDAQLDTRGREGLLDYKESHAYEGEIEALHTFVYGRDFFIGDILSIEDGYGNSGTVRVTEVVISFDERGYSIYPTFESTEETEVE